MSNATIMLMMKRVVSPSGVEAHGDIAAEKIAYVIAVI
jgi:hypothetical protein